MKILVIKHGALGDIVLAFPAFAAIRQAHPAAEITLLTTRPYLDFLKASPWFDKIETDSRPEPWDIPGLFKLRHQLRGFEMVYDLQTSSRSSRYFMLAGRPPWSGIAKGCTFFHANPKRDSMHTRERLAEQLAFAGITTLPEPDLSWAISATISRFNLPHEFALLAPGAAAHRPEKRWPPENFIALATALPLPSVIVGAVGETFQNTGLDLTGKTTLLELAAITARAKIAIGNDTGPMHLAAALNIPSTVLFSRASDPALTAPCYPDGSWPVILREANLQDLQVAQVLSTLP